MGPPGHVDRRGRSTSAAWTSSLGSAIGAGRQPVRIRLRQRHTTARGRACGNSSRRHAGGLRARQHHEAGEAANNATPWRRTIRRRKTGGDERGDSTHAVADAQRRRALRGQATGERGSGVIARPGRCAARGKEGRRAVRQRTATVPAPQRQPQLAIGSAPNRGPRSRKRRKRTRWTQKPSRGASQGPHGAGAGRQSRKDVSAARFMLKLVACWRHVPAGARGQADTCPPGTVNLRLARPCDRLLQRCRLRVGSAAQNLAHAGEECTDRQRVSPTSASWKPGWGDLLNATPRRVPPARAGTAVRSSAGRHGSRAGRLRAATGRGATANSTLHSRSCWLTRAAALRRQASAHAQERGYRRRHDRFGKRHELATGTGPAIGRTHSPPSDGRRAVRGVHRTSWLAR